MHLFTKVFRPISRAENRRKVPVAAFNVSPETVAEFHDCDGMNHRTWRRHVCCCTLDGGCCLRATACAAASSAGALSSFAPLVRQPNSYSDHKLLSFRRLTDHSDTAFTSLPTQSELQPGQDCAGWTNWERLPIGVHWLHRAGSRGSFFRWEMT